MRLTCTEHAGSRRLGQPGPGPTVEARSLASAGVSAPVGDLPSPSPCCIPRRAGAPGPHGGAEGPPSKHSLLAPRLFSESYSHSECPVPSYLQLSLCCGH